MDPGEVVEIEIAEMEAVFTEWDRRYREDPTAFYSDVQRFLDGQTIEEYGQAATQTFLMFFKEIQEKDG